MQNEDIVYDDIKKIAELLAKDNIKSLQDKTLLITGGSGFLGRYILGTLAYLNKHILKKPCKVICLDNYITSSKLKEYDKDEYIHFIKYDVAKPFKTKEKIDYIMHAAGIASPSYYKKYPLETIDVTVTGVKNMLELARKNKIKSFMFFSSSEIYGDPTPDAIPTKETYRGNVSSIGPRSCYDESKRLGETLCMVYHSVYKIPVKIVRPFNVFGPGMKPNDYRVIPSFIFNALNNKPIPVHVSGKQTRSFCYISDATVGLIKVLLSNKNGEVYNVGNNSDEINMNRLAQVLNKIFDNKIKIKHIPYPKGYPPDEPQRRCPDLTKINKELGYTPKVDLEKGLKRTIDWCKNNWK